MSGKPTESITSVYERKLNQLEAKINSYVKNGNMRAIRDMQPVEQAITALLFGFLDDAIFTDEPSTPTETPSHLHDLIHLLQQRPYLDVTKNQDLLLIQNPRLAGDALTVNEKAQFPLNLSSAIEQQAIKLDPLLAGFIEVCATRSLASRRAQQYRFVEGIDEKTYYQHFLTKLTNFLSTFRAGNTLPMRDPEKNYELAKTQLLIISWSLAYTHTTGIDSGLVFLQKQTLPETNNYTPEAVAILAGQGYEVRFPLELLTSDAMQKQKEERAQKAKQKKQEIARRNSINTGILEPLNRALAELSTYCPSTQAKYKSLDPNGLKKAKVDAMTPVIEHIKGIISTVSDDDFSGISQDGRIVKEADEYASGCKTALEKITQAHQELSDSLETFTHRRNFFISILKFPLKPGAKPTKATTAATNTLEALTEASNFIKSSLPADSKSNCGPGGGGGAPAR